MGVGVVREILQEVGLVQVRRVAVADDRAEVDPQTLSLAGDVGAVATALAHERDAARALGEIVAGQEGQAVTGVVDAEAVGPDHPEAALARYRERLLLEALPALAGLLEAGRHHYDRLDPDLGAVGQHLDRAVSGYGQVDQVWGRWKRNQVGIGGPAHYLVLVGVDQVERAVEPHGHLRAGEHVAELGR